MSPLEILRHPEKLEEVERSAFRLVEQALRDYIQQAANIFRHETDTVADIAEDVTREALDALGMPQIPNRLFGKVDYKRAGYVFLPDRTAEVALLVDSKAEKGDASTATIQTSQTSMQIRLMRTGKTVEEQGKLPRWMKIQGERELLTVTIIVKYAYREESPESDGDEMSRHLEEIILLCLPNGELQDIYNPSPEDTFWSAGRDAPTRGEDFRVRVSIKRLADKAAWRVVRIPVSAP